MQITRRGFGVAGIVLGLAACGSKGEEGTEPTTAVTEPDPDGDVDAGEPTAYPQGDFTTQNETGAVFTLHIPTEAPADVEAYRQAVKQPEVGYISIDIDNTKGTDKASPSGVTIVDETGASLEYQSAFIPIGDWGPTMMDDGPEDENDGYYYQMPDGTKITEDEYDTLRDQGSTVYDAYLNDTVPPTGKGVAYYIGPPVPEKFTYVEVTEALVTFPAGPVA